LNFFIGFEYDPTPEDCAIVKEAFQQKLEEKNQKNFREGNECPR
jgi:hypothetical protein